MMKKLLMLCLCGFLYANAHAQNEVLTNTSIVEMIELGFESDIIISKIETATTNFDTSIEALRALKDQNVPSAVLAAMVNAGKKNSVVVEKTGIFFFNPEGAEQKLLPTTFTGSKTRTLAAGLTYGIASGKVKSVLNSSTSRNTVPANAEFVFYFLPFKDTQMLATDWWFRAATSPNEFALVVLDVNKGKDIRELETGKVNAWVGADVGVKKDNVVGFDMTEIGNGVYKVTPREPLPPGEYCFFYQGTVPQGGVNNQSVFDFSVKE